MTASLLLALVLLPAQQAPPVRSTETVDISGGSAYGQLSVAAGGDFSGVMWLHDHLNIGRYGVYVSPAGGRGTGYGTPVRIDADPTDSTASLYEDSLQVAGEGVYGVWVDRRDQDPGAFGTESELYFARSTDAGATWQPEQRLEKGIPAGVGYALELRFAAEDRRTPAAGDDQLHLAVLVGDPAASVQSLSYLRSRDGGATWLPPRTITPNTVHEMQMAVDGPHVHLGWMEWRGIVPEVFYQRSDDGGATWLPQPLALTPGSTLVMSGALALAADGPVVAVSWTERTNSSYAPAIHARISRDGGRRWGPPSLVGNYPLGSAFVRDPDLSVRRGTVALAWADNRAMIGHDSFQTFVAATRDHGATWFESAVSAGEGRAPQFAGGGRGEGHLVLAYTTDLVQGEVECATSRDDGLHWSTGFPVSSRPDRVLLGRVAWNDRYDNAVVAWLGSNSIQRIRSYASGFRPQHVTADGWFAPGGMAWFEVAGFPVADEGSLFGVLVSGGEGDWRFNSKARDTGLLWDGVLAASLGMIPGQLSGTIQPGGIGQTSVMTIPAGMPSGKTLSFAAFGLRLPSSEAAWTDVQSLTLN